MGPMILVLSLSLLIGSSLSDRPSSESGGGWNSGSSGGNWNSRPDSSSGGHFLGGGNSGGHFNPGHNEGRPESGSGGHFNGGERPGQEVTIAEVTAVVDTSMMATTAAGDTSQ